MLLIAYLEIFHWDLPVMLNLLLHYCKSGRDISKKTMFPAASFTAGSESANL